MAETLSPGERGGAHQERLLRAAAIEAGRRRLETLLTDGSPLCFGRIDTGAEESFHIGRAGVADEGGDQLVVDWRAPVAEPFYRATALTPMGLRRRRHIRTRDGRVVALDDEWLDAALAPDETGLSLVGEAALMAAVTKSRTGRMGDIVATIQAEQDRVIRAPISGVLVVAGGPGTGKTAVALHRAAYLLYTYRHRLERVGVLVVGPNPVFLRYIERVLPSLDESAVVLATPAQLYQRLTSTVAEPAATSALKGDRRMAAVLAGGVAGRQRPLARPTVVPYGAHELKVSRKVSAALVERAAEHGGPHNEGHRRFRRLLLSYLYRQYMAALERSASPGQAARPAAPFTDFVASMEAEPAFRAALHRMWPALSPEGFLADLLSHPALLEAASSGLLGPAERELLFKKVPADGPAWSSADIALLDEAAALLGPLNARRRRPKAQPLEDAAWMADRVVADLEDIGVGVDSEMVQRARQLVEDNVRGPVEEARPAWPREFAHVVVDEAQELTAMQWRMLARRCPSGSFTVAGDLSQASEVLAGAGWTEALAELPGAAAASLSELTVNYRTPSEVMDLAASVLAAARPGATPPKSLRSAGVPPTVRKVRPGRLVTAAVAAAGAERAVVDSGTVAVIAPVALVASVRATAEQDAATAQAGAELLDGPVSVLSLAEAKGLEFDSVVLAEPSALVDEAADGLAALYVALTRTTTRLVIVHERPLPKPLHAALRTA